MKIGSLCTGYGGLDHAAERHYGASTAWHAENAAAPSRVLAHHHPDTPNLGDLTAIDWANVEPVDIITAGYPCQPFSTAGLRKGTRDPRHLWPSIARAVGVLRPRLLVVENVADHLTLGFDSVLNDLAALGYDASWGLVRASDAGAPHQRARLFVVATDAADRPGEPQRARSEPRGGGPAPADATSTRQPRRHSEQEGPVPAGSPDAPADAESERRERAGRARQRRPGPADGSPTPAHPDTERREGLAQLDPPVPAGQPGAPGRHTDGRSDDPGRGQSPGGRDTAWGVYAPAIRRWEAVLGRVAPTPTVLSRTTGRPVLNPELVEWMLGLAHGYVTSPAIGLTHAAQLRTLGNGVVPAQAELALRLLDPQPP